MTFGKLRGARWRGQWMLAVGCWRRARDLSPPTKPPLAYARVDRVKQIEVAIELVCGRRGGAGSNLEWAREGHFLLDSPGTHREPIRTTSSRVVSYIPVRLLSVFGRLHAAGETSDGVTTRDPRWAGRGHGVGSLLDAGHARSRHRTSSRILAHRWDVEHVIRAAHMNTGRIVV